MSWSIILLKSLIGTAKIISQLENLTTLFFTPASLLCFLILHSVGSQMMFLFKMVSFKQFKGLRFNFPLRIPVLAFIWELTPSLPFSLTLLGIVIIRLRDGLSCPLIWKDFRKFPSLQGTIPYSWHERQQRTWSQKQILSKLVCSWGGLVLAACALHTLRILEFSNISSREHHGYFFI